MIGRVHRPLTVPTMALCERCGESIEWIAPSEDDGEVVTVADRPGSLTTASDAPSVRF